MEFVIFSEGLPTLMLISCWLITQKLGKNLFLTFQFSDRNTLRKSSTLHVLSQAMCWPTTAKPPDSQNTKNDAGLLKTCMLVNFLT